MEEILHLAFEKKFQTGSNYHLQVASINPKGDYALKCWLILLLLIPIYLKCWQHNQPNEENRTKTPAHWGHGLHGEESANRQSEWAGEKCWYFQKIFLSSL